MIMRIKTKEIELHPVVSNAVNAVSGFGSFVKTNILGGFRGSGQFYFMGGVNRPQCRRERWI